MYAVIKTGGKQHRVTEGEMLSVEKIEAEEGRLVDFDQVLLIENGDDIQVGAPILSGAVVRAEVVENYKDKKIIVFKKKRRKGYKKTRGHRQHLTKIRVEKIIPDISLLSEEERAASIPAVEVVEKKAAPVTAAKTRKSPAPAAKKAKTAPKKTETSPSEKKAVEKPAAKKAAKPRAVKTAAKTTAKPAKKTQE
jgi:large subunit ribosomal protein L21